MQDNNFKKSGKYQHLILLDFIVLTMNESNKCSNNKKNCYSEINFQMST